MSNNNSKFRSNKSSTRLAVNEVSHYFSSHGSSPGVLHVLRNITFVAGAREFVSIIGPSGCGKSTLLNLIAGIEEPSEGDIHISHKPSTSRLGFVGYMHQDDLLLPWRSIVDNATLGLELEGLRKKEARDRAYLQMERFGLSGFEDSYPSQLSGGMRQRVALLRAMLPNRELLLLDEPFGALDALTRNSLHLWLNDILESSDKTVLLVTHNVEEAIMLSDTVHIMTPRPGHIGTTIPINLPRPRTELISVEKNFIELKRQIMQELAALSLTL